MRRRSGKSILTGASCGPAVSPFPSAAAHSRSWRFSSSTVANWSTNTISSIACGRARWSRKTPSISTSPPFARRWAADRATAQHGFRPRLSPAWRLDHPEGKQAGGWDAISGTQAEAAVSIQCADRGIGPDRSKRSQAASAQCLVGLSRRHVDRAGRNRKERLALEVARSLFPTFEGDCWLVELASPSNPALVPSAVVPVLGLKIGGKEISAKSVARAIGSEKASLFSTIASISLRLRDSRKPSSACAPMRPC